MHRTACLAGDTILYFDLPKGNHGTKWKRCNNTIEELYKRWQKGNRYREDIRKKKLRHCNESTMEIDHTHISNIFYNGVETIYRVILEDGKEIKCTSNHRLLFSDGWSTLNDKLKMVYHNGIVSYDKKDVYLMCNGIKKYQDKDRKKKKPSTKNTTTIKIAKPIKIVDIQYVGKEDVYDIKVDSEYHNFIANGIITHNSVNEYSTRYSEAISDMATTFTNAWRVQSSTNKQGSAGCLNEETGRVLSAEEAALQEMATRTYQKRLEIGVAREQARKDLPLSTYTEAYWKMDLRNLLHFLALRLDEHAQVEIRLYAQEIAKIVKELYPLTWEAFEDYILYSMTFSRLEQKILKQAIDIPSEEGIMELCKSHNLSRRESSDFYNKVCKLKNEKEKENTVGKVE